MTQEEEYNILLSVAKSMVNRYLDSLTLPDVMWDLTYHGHTKFHIKNVWISTPEASHWSRNYNKINLELVRWIIEFRCRFKPPVLLPTLYCNGYTSRGTTFECKMNELTEKRPSLIRRIFGI